MTPKSLLRHKQAGLAGRPLDRRATSTTCSTTRPRPTASAASCSARARSTTTWSPSARRSASQRDVAIVRLEQLYPWPADELQSGARPLPVGPRVGLGPGRVAEHGGWTFVAPRLQELLGSPFQYVGRDASASPATGSKLVHDREQAELVEAAVGAGRASPGLRHRRSDRARPSPAAARSELTMPAVPVTVPCVGESITEGILVALAQGRRLARPGRASRSSSWRPTRPPASSRPPARASCKIAVAEGETVAIGATVGTIDPADPAAGRSASAAEDRAAARGQQRHRREDRRAAHRPPPRRARRRPTALAGRPPARRRGRASTSRQVAATGPGGRLTKGDVLDLPRVAAAPGAGAGRPLRAARCRAAPAAASAAAGPDRAPRNPPADERPPPADRPAPGRGPADRRDPHDLQRSRHVAGDGAAHPVQGVVPEEARRRRSASCRSSSRRRSRRSRRFPPSTPASTATRSSTRISTTSAWPSAPSAA